MAVKDSPVKFSRPEDINPVEMERQSRFYREIHTDHDNRIASLESQLAAAIARIVALETGP